jgi:hypothetical protein
MKQPEVLYCHRCGKRARRSGGLCWYCNADLIREIRPARACPFCGEEIAQQAIKCPHCAEFLDGRPKPNAAPNGGQQVTFVIDKAVFGAGAAGVPTVTQVVGQTLVGGAGAPLSNPGQALGFQGDALPPPAAAEIAYQEARALPAPASANGNALVRQTNVVRSSGAPLDDDGYLVVHEQPAAPVVKARVVEQPVMVPPVVPEAKPVAAPSAEVAAPSRYKTCVNCETELLAGDNYCFHCGALTPGGKALRPLKDDGKSNTVYFFLSMLCMFFLVLHTFAHAIKFEIPANWVKSEYLSAAVMGCIAGAFLLLFAAFFRKRGLGNQIICILLLLLWFVISAGALFFDPIAKLLS